MMVAASTYFKVNKGHNIAPGCRALSAFCTTEFQVRGSFLLTPVASTLWAGSRTVFTIGLSVGEVTLAARWKAAIAAEAHLMVLKLPAICMSNSMYRATIRGSAVR